MKIPWYPKWMKLNLGEVMLKYEEKNIEEEERRGT